MKKEESDLIPCEMQQGFYVVPGNERFSVSREGTVFDRQNNEIAKSSTNTEPSNSKTYLSVYDCPVHRLVAETFLSKEHIPSGEFAIVNHLDGNIRNNRCDNLEWTTYKGNSLHAFSTGLRPDNIPLLCKDPRTGKITRYFSYWECARAFNTNGANVHAYLNRKNFHRLFLDRFLLIREGEEWPELDIELCQRLACRELMVHNRETQDAYIFTDASAACGFLKISSSFLSKLLKKAVVENKKTSAWREWDIMPLIYAENWIKEKAADKRTEKRPQVFDRSNNRRKPLNVTVRSLETNETKTYESLEEFCVQIGEKKNTVQKHILVNKGIWRGLFEIRYL